MQIDYVTYDHLHTQDLRRLMLEWCPRARLLAMEAELAIFDRLHPLQRDWYIPDALAGIPASRLVAARQRHARRRRRRARAHARPHARQSLDRAAHRSRAVDHQRERRRRRQLGARAQRDRGPPVDGAATGAEVILNSNTREESLEQYTSMVLEKTLADEAPDGSGWRQHFSSSELTPSLLAPGLRAELRAPRHHPRARAGVARTTVRTRARD